MSMPIPYIATTRGWCHLAIMALGFVALPAWTLQAQVQLVYRTQTGECFVNGVVNGVPVYTEGGQRRAIPEEGEWALRQGGSYAKDDVAIDVRHWLRFSVIEAQGTGGLQANVTATATLKAHKPPADMFVFWAWEVAGELRHVKVTSFSPAWNGGETGARAEIYLEPDEERGQLRVFVFSDGNQLNGVADEERSSLVLQAAIETGDKTALLKWAANASKGTAVPFRFFRRIVQDGDAELVEALFKAGAINKQSLYGENTTVLNYAVEASQAATVATLLRHGLPPDTRDNIQQTPLLVATVANALPVLERLVTGGANVNLDAGHPPTLPLMEALTHEYMPLVEYLLKHGAGWPHQTERLNQSLSIAVATGHKTAAAQLLGHGAEPTARIFGAASLLHSAVRQQDLGMVRILIDHGANPNLQDPDGVTPLMRAAEDGDTLMADALLQGGAHPELLDRTKKTAAEAALAAGHPETARLILARQSMSPAVASRLLQASVIRGDRDTAAWLLERDAHLDVKSSDLAAVLDGAIRSDMIDVFKMALDQGVDPDRHVFGEWTLAALARRYSCSDISAYLRAKLGTKFNDSVPPLESLPVSVTLRPDHGIPKQLLAAAIFGIAEVEIYIDHNGLPRFPSLIRADHPEVGASAIEAIMNWRFNSLASKQALWRKAVVSVEFSEDGMKAKGIPIAEALDRPPQVYKRESPSAKMLEPEHWQAAWVRCVVNEIGRVVAPQVVVITDHGVAAEALAAVRRWEFRPGLKDGRRTACWMDILVLLPAGIPLPQNEALPYGSVVRQGEIQSPKVKKMALPDYPEKGLPRRLNGLVLLRYVISTEGKVENCVVLSSSDPMFSKVAVAAMKRWRYEPAIKDGVPIEIPSLFVCRFVHPLNSVY